MCIFHDKIGITILIFDTGIGGLSVYNKIKKKMYNIQYIYYFDNEKFPYGEKSRVFIVNRVIKIISSLSKKHKIDFVIIACNTVSVTSLSILRNCFPYPIFGVIPDIKSASKLTNNHIIGLLATKITVNHDQVCNLIRRFAFNCLILKLKTSSLVNIAENKLYGKKIIIPTLKNIFDSWLTRNTIPDVIVLGCTHFSFIKSELKKVFPKKTCFIDSSTSLIKKVKKILLQKYRSGFLEKNVDIKNIIYCSTLHIRTKKLIPILLRYGFHKLRVFKI